MMDDKLKIGILTLPLARATLTPLTNFVDILFNFSKEFVLVTGNEGYKKFKNESRFKVYEVSYKIENKPFQIIRNLNGQIKASLILIKEWKRIDLWFFFGGERAIIVMIIAKLLKKKNVILLLGSATESSKFNQDPFKNVIKILSDVKFITADKIFVYSPLLISRWHLQSHLNKIVVVQRHFLDFSLFKITTPYANRLPIIGYIGRISGEKGIQNFAYALPTIFNNHKDLKVLIGGDGPLNESIKGFLIKKGLIDRVECLGWIPHDDVPNYLNKLKLLVVPSYTEGLPNIILEAMACGTPVLATQVGAIPNIIRDGETGFFMESNQPDCISENIKKILNSPNLYKIIENGQAFVESNYNFEKAVAAWKEIFKKI
jgi:glycosyltransferase involved in cell wall biosynthesis